MSKPTCGACRFFHRTVTTNPATDGLCCRYPPALLYDTHKAAHRVWPEMGDQEWCGEHKPTPSDDA